MGLVFGLISLATLAAGVVLLVAAAATESAVLIIFVAVCLLLAFVAIALVSSALERRVRRGGVPLRRGRAVGRVLHAGDGQSAFRAK